MNPCNDLLEAIDVDSPCIVQRSGLIADIIFENDSGGSAQATYPNLSLRYGIGKNLELLAVAPTRITTGANGAGISDAGLGLQYGFGESRLQYGLAAMSFLATGTPRFSSAPSFALTGSVAYGLSPSVSVVSAVALSSFNAQDDVGTLSRAAAVGYSVELQSEIAGGTEIQMVISQLNQRRLQPQTTRSIGLGVNHLLGRRAAITFGVNRDFTPGQVRSDGVTVGSAVFF